jgi:glycine cleavage system pyridoxal-binding protein P
MCFSVHGEKRKTIFVSNKIFPQSIEVIKTWAKPLGVTVQVGDPNTVDFKTRTDLMGVVL